MKVCNLDTVTAPEDILQLSDVICKEAPLLVIVPAFDWIKRSLQDISIHLFRAEEEKASQAILHLENAAWKRCPDSCPIMVLPLSLPKHRSHPTSNISGNWQTARSASPTNADCLFRENTFLPH